MFANLNLWCMFDDFALRCVYWGSKIKDQSNVRMFCGRDCDNRRPEYVHVHLSVHVHACTCTIDTYYYLLSTMHKLTSNMYACMCGQITVNLLMEDGSSNVWKSRLSSLVYLLCTRSMYAEHVACTCHVICHVPVRHVPGRYISNTCTCVACMHVAQIEWAYSIIVYARTHRPV